MSVESPEAQPLVECVPNFSEGRDPAIIRQLASAIVSVPGVLLLDQTSDADHNRSVFTFAGPPGAVREAAVAAVVAASRLIDLRTHDGVHPFIGAADVVPFVPLRGTSLSDCAALAHHAGQQIWKQARVPVYFYEAAALRPERSRLEEIRRGGFRQLRHASLEDPARQPDVGGPALHPSGGATVVGARRFLIAYNINLATEDISLAKSIARRIRTSSGGLPCLKALGLPLERRHQVQVSMNLTDYETTPLALVFETVRRLATEAGVEIAGSELIGLIPSAALHGTEHLDLRWENFNADCVLEHRLTRLARERQGVVP